MTKLKEETRQLLCMVRNGVNGSDEDAMAFLEGLLTKQEIPTLNRRGIVRATLVRNMEAGIGDSFRSVARECGCSEDLVSWVWRDIRDQYPPTFPSSDAFVVALPKETRPFNLIDNILFQSGFRIDPAAKSIVDTRNGMPPLAYRVMRGRDMPVYLKTGIVNVGFLGNDKVKEVQAEAREYGNDPVELDIRKEFYVNAFRMCLAVPRDTSAIQKVADLQGKVIATSYVATLKQFLAAQDIVPRKVLYLSGGVEEACRDLGADAIMDIVETGGSLRKNNLVVLDKPLYAGNMSLMTLKNTPRSTTLDRLTDRLSLATDALRAA